MFKNKTKLLWAAALVVAVLFVMPKIFSSSASKNKLEAVRSVKVKRDDIRVEITATGEVKPQNRVEIKPPIGGRLEEVLVEEGGEVKKGQILAWMSSTDRAALLDAARAKGPETLKEWEEAYKPAPLIAPLDGTIIVQTIRPGQTISVSDPVVVISDRLIAKALVDETDLAQIQVGQKTKIELDAYPGREILGTVDHINYESTLINNVNVYSVDVVPDEIPKLFRSGMTATVTFIIAEKKDVLVVPADAVTSWPKKMANPKKAEFAIYKKSFGGKLTPVPVEIGESDTQNVEVVSGLKEKEVIQIVQRGKRGPGGDNPFGRSRQNQNRNRSQS